MKTVRGLKNKTEFKSTLNRARSFFFLGATLSTDRHSDCNFTNNLNANKAFFDVSYFQYIFFSFLFFLVTSPSSFALTNAQSFTYQGRFLNSAGTAPLSDVIDVTFSIYDPGATCLLYQESQTGIDLTATQGIFAVQVGTVTSSPKRTVNDPNLPMAKVFSNTGTITGSAGCTYTPVAGNNRRLRVTVTPHSTMVANNLSPDQAINSVPQAQTAETLQGLDPTGFIQAASGVAGQGNVSLANLISLTGAGDASSLHNHDSLYVKQGGMSSTSLGSSAYTSGYFGIGISTPTTDLDFGGNVARTIQVDRNTSTATGSALNVIAGGAKSGGTDQAGGTLVLSGGIATGSGGSNILFNTASGGTSGTADSSPTTKMVLTSTGKLGVGTASPTSQLEVDSGSTSTIGAIIKGIAGQVANLFEARDSANTLLAKIDPTGKIFGSGLDASSQKVTNVANPTLAQDAATKNYVDTSISALSTGVSSFNTRTGAITLTSADVTGALTYTPLKNSSDSMTGTLGVGGVVGANTQFQSTSTSSTNVTAVLKEAASQSADLLQFQNSASAVLSKVDANGMLTLAGAPTAGLHSATKSYVDTLIAGTQPAGNYITALTSDVSAAGPGSAAATVNSVGGSSAANIRSAELLANAATNLNTASAIVKRDGSGNFSAGTISANLTGNVTGNLTGNVTGNVTGAASLNVLKAGDTMTGQLKLNTPVTADALAQILIATGADTNKGLVVQAKSATQSANLAEFQSSTGSVLAKVDPTGKIFGTGMDAGSAKITSLANPTAAQDAATKTYVDTQIASGVGAAVTSFNTRTGAITLSSADVTTALTYTPLKNTTDTLTGNLTVTAVGGFGGAAGANTQLQSTATAATQIGQVIKGAASQTADLQEWQNSAGTVLSKVDSTGYLTLPGVPTTANMAATKGYVDAQVAAGVTSFNTRTGAVTLSSADVTTALTYTPLKNSSDTMSGTLGVGGAVGANTQFRSIATAATNVGAVVQGAASQSADLLDFLNSGGATLAKFDSAGMLTLAGAPTAALHAATKSYVDTATSGIVTATTGTAGYISQFSAPNTLVNSPVYVSGSNVGIGTTTPLSSTKTTIYNGSGVGGNTLALEKDGGTAAVAFGSATNASGLIESVSGGGFQFYNGSGAWATPGWSTTMKIDNSGNVGIGTSNPSAQLDVVGTSNTYVRVGSSGTNAADRGILFADAAGAPAGYITLVPNTTNTNSTMQFYVGGGAGSNIKMTMLNSGNVGIGTTSPNAKLEVNGNIYTSAESNYLQFGTNTATAPYVAGDTSHNLYLGTSNAAKMTILNGGNVGIGTTTPQSQLTLDGVAAQTTAALTDAGTRGGLIEVLGAGGAAGNGGGIVLGTNTQGNNTGRGQVAIKSILTSGAGMGLSDLAFSTRNATSDTALMERMRITSSGNVGIGITAPAIALDVKGPDGAPGMSNEGVRVRAAATSDQMGFGTDSTNRVSWIRAYRSGVGENNLSLQPITGGNVGIGTTAPAYKLDVVGDINASGNVRAAGVALTSDERLKANIVPVENSLEKISKLKGVNYYWKDKTTRGSNLQLGVIAQDVEKVFPEAVLTDSRGSKSVLYTSLIGPIVNAIKEFYSKWTQDSAAIHQEVDQLKSSDTKLTEKVLKLETENLALKAQLKSMNNRAPASVDQARIKALEEKLNHLEKALDSK